MNKKIESFIFNFLEEMPDIIGQEEKSLSELDNLGVDYPDLSTKIGEISDSFIHLHSKLKSQFFQWGLLAGKISDSFENI